VFSVRSAAADAAPLPAALPGQFLTLRLHPEGGGPPVIRSYSLSGRPGGADYRISVKQEPHGAASGYLRSHLGAGDTLEVAAPRGIFILAAGDRPVLLLSVGIGATPVLAMLHTLAAEHSPRGVWWLHGARNRTKHPIAQESRALLATCRTRTHTSATAGPAPTTGGASTTQPPAGCPPTCSTSSTSPGPPTPTCAARQRSCEK
jgi:ferredoxin-NADP reductase